MDFDVTEFVVSRDDNPLVVWTWYAIGDHPAANDFEVKEREAVTLWLTSVNTPRPLHSCGTVAWSTETADGTFCVGVRFDRRLSYADFSRLI